MMHTPRRGRTAALAVLAMFTAIAGPRTLAAQVPQVTPQGITVNFQNAELAYVLAALAQVAGINYSASDLPAKQITLRTPRPISADETRILIRDLARSHGVTVVEDGIIMRLQGQPEQQGPDARQLYIYRLKHARAPVLAQTLQSLFGGGAVTARTTPAQAAQTMQAQLRALELQAQQQRQGQQQGGVVITSPTITLRSGETGDVQIVPDEVTNTLLVRATPADWIVVQQALQALDLRPLQVVIEVVIADVRRTDDLNVGTSITATDNRVRDGNVRRGVLPGTDREGDFSLRIVSRGDIDVEATLSALAASGRVRILSRPVILAQNNQEAHIAVGEQRPFIQVSRSLPTGEPIRDEVVQYIDVVTGLTILPTINEDGYVNLAVTQEINAATAEVQFGAPVISTRTANTQILARNGQTVVLGGLVDRQHDRTRSGVPFLKDIPLLGYLFGSTRENTVHSELFLFLTPYVVATDEEADRVREEIERNAEQLAPLTPIRPILPPVIRPDTIRPDTIRPDTIPGVVSLDLISPRTIPPDPLRGGAR